MHATGPGAHLRYVVTGGRTSAGTDRACRADRVPKFENSRMVWTVPRIDYNYVCRELMLWQSLQNKSASPTDWTDYTDIRWFSTHVSLDHWWSHLPIGHLASLELSSADRHGRCSQFPCSGNSLRLCRLPAATTVNATYCLRRDPVFQSDCTECVIICPRPLQVDLWPFDLGSGVRVACDVGYLCGNFSLPRPLCSRLRPDVRDRRQTDIRHMSDSIIA